jgi:hypothetical protein
MIFKERTRPCRGLAALAVVAAHTIGACEPSINQCTARNYILRCYTMDRASCIGLLPISGNDNVMLVNVSGIAVDQPDPFAAAAHDLLLDFAWMPDIVRVELCNGFAACANDAKISGNCIPWLGCRKNMIRASSRLTRSTTAAVESLDPSSTTMISSRVYNAPSSLTLEADCSTARP